MAVKRIPRSTPRTVEQFMTAMRGVPVRTLIRAINGLTLGVNWSGCSKTLIAESWARGYAHSNMHNVSLDDIRMGVRMPADAIYAEWLQLVRANQKTDRTTLQRTFAAMLIAQHSLTQEYVERCLRRIN